MQNFHRAARLDMLTDRPRAIREEDVIVLVNRAIAAMRDFLGREPSYAEIDVLLAKISEHYRGARFIEGRRCVAAGEAVH